MSQRWRGRGGGGGRGWKRKRPNDGYPTREEPEIVNDEVKTPEKENKGKVIFVLDKASLKRGFIGKTAKILNSDEDAASLQEKFIAQQKKHLGLDDDAKSLQKLKDHKRRHPELYKEFNPDDYRPDILYRALLAIFDSPLSKAGMIQAVYVEVDEGVLFEVKPHVRVPRTFKRFCGLMLELLEKQRVTTKDTHERLLQVIEKPITRHLPPNSRIIGLSYSSDKIVKLEDYVATFCDDDVNLVFVIGAMARGKIDVNKMDMDDLISVSNYPLSSSRCIGHICDALEDKWNII